MNRKLSWGEESENVDWWQKKWKWKKESWEKRRQKLVPTEEDEKSCHGHISCLQWIFFPKKNSSKSMATPQQRKRSSIALLQSCPAFFKSFLKCLASAIFSCVGVICWNSFHSCVSMLAITIEIPDWIDFAQSRQRYSLPWNGNNVFTTPHAVFSSIPTDFHVDQKIIPWF